MITITNSIFNAQGASNKDKVYGIVLGGNEDVVIKDCAFTNKGYSSILNNSTGNLTVDGCNFKCDNVYNPIEGSQAVNNGNVKVKDCVFQGVPGNNFVNFYQFADGSEHEISGCRFRPHTNNNIIRISNRTSAKANFVMKNCDVSYTGGSWDEDQLPYTAVLLCQDYTSKGGVKQDFTGLNVEFDTVIYNGKKLVPERPFFEGSAYYVYEDGRGIITGENDPVVTYK